MHVVDFLVGTDRLQACMHMKGEDPLSDMLRVPLTDREAGLRVISDAR